jgi:hypothetical protein
MKWIRGARYNSRDVSSAEAGPGGHKALLAVGGLRMHTHTHSTGSGSELARQRREKKRPVIGSREANIIPAPF